MARRHNTIGGHQKLALIQRMEAGENVSGWRRKLAAVANGFTIGETISGFDVTSTRSASEIVTKL